MSCARPLGVAHKNNSHSKNIPTKLGLQKKQSICGNVFIWYSSLIQNESNFLQHNSIRKLILLIFDNKSVSQCLSCAKEEIDRLKCWLCLIFLRLQFLNWILSLAFTGSSISIWDDSSSVHFYSIQNALSLIFITLAKLCETFFREIIIYHEYFFAAAYKFSSWAQY